MNNEFSSFYILFDEDKKKAKEIGWKCAKKHIQLIEKLLNM